MKTAPALSLACCADGVRRTRRYDGGVGLAPGTRADRAHARATACHGCEPPLKVLILCDPMPAAVSPEQIAARLTEYWSPRIVGEVDDNYIKVARLLGVFGWHAHASEDEMFLVLKGRLRIEMEAGAVEIGAGEFYVVPKGVRHNPVAEEEVHVLLFERKSTLHAGGEDNPHTRSIEEQLRPV